MPTSANANEPPSPHDRTRDHAEGGTRATIAVLIAVVLVCLVAEVTGAIQRIERVSYEVTPQPPPSPGPATQAAASQAQPVASPATKQAALQGALESQAASAVREPEMNMLRGGTFMMGSNDDANEKPIHHVTVKPFAISRYPVSVREWNECAAAKACGFVASGKGDAPATNVSWSDAKQFVTWLAGTTRKPYRLPSEAEWEFAARGGTQTRYWWGDKFQPGMANCKNCAEIAAAEQPVRVGSFKPNPFGLYDMGGGDQWVEDCWPGTITAHHPTVHRGSRATASRLSFAPAPGKMTRVMCGRPTATATTRRSDIQHMDFGLLSLLEGFR